MTPSMFACEFDVSRETIGRLKIFAELLVCWNARINLVAPGTLEDLWARHIADSAQLLGLAPPAARNWIDLGSGAGFPGLPVAAIAAEARSGFRMTLVESDSRKAAFLRAAAAEMRLDVIIEARRIETISRQTFDVVSARALAPLDRLCSLAAPFAGPGTVFLFPKGARVDSELTAAACHWHIRAERIPSRTEPDATILKVLELEPRS